MDFESYNLINLSLIQLTRVQFDKLKLNQSLEKHG